MTMMNLYLLLLLVLGFWQAPASTSQKSMDEVRVRIETEKGNIIVAVDARRAPATAANFLRYVDAGQYEGGRFHRTVRRNPDNQPNNQIKIEVIQGGVDPAKEAVGYPPIPLERTSFTGLRHLNGVISMARSGPDSATSDFFICVGDQPELDYGGKRNPDGQGFAAFGRVVQGMEIVKRIHQAPYEAQALKPPIRILRIVRVTPLRAPAASASPEALAKSVTIQRDKYGVPHIFGRTDAATVFGLMCAQCEDNFEQLATDLLRSIGRAAELGGERGLANDRLYQAFEVERLSKEEYDRLPAPMKALCDAYAAGINHYMKEHPEAKPRLLIQAEPWHILAANRMGRLGGLNRIGIGQAVLRVGEPLNGPAPSNFMEELEDLDEGSNMWVVGPAKSATGRAMLLINPHVGFFGGGQRYEAHLISEEGMNVYGFAILGTPYIRSGFTPNLGWSHTNNYADTVDGYLETFDQTDKPLAYRYGDVYRDAVEWEAAIKVKTERGIETRKFRFRKTHHGPIVGVLNGRPVAARVARVAEGGELEQRFAMNKARTFAEFKAALERVALTGSNTIYADRTGKIYYVHGNGMPKRATNLDWTKPVEGKLLETEWQGYHRLDELPQMLNPTSGYLQNCNSTPFLMTEKGSPKREDYPAYMAPEEDTARARSSRRILNGKRKFTFEEWTRAATDTTVEEAAKGIESLAAEWETMKREDEARAEQIKPALLELKAWDRVARIDSVPATVFLLWFERMRAGRGNDLGITLRGEGAAGNQPEEKFKQLRALEEVVAKLERDFNDWHVPWGEINRLQRIHTSGEEPFSDLKPSYPVMGGPGAAGMIFTYNARAEKGQARRFGISGNSFVAVVEFGAQVKARSILVFGQSADPKSPHHLDQAELYAEGKFKPVRFSPAEIKANLERAYQP